MTARGSEVGEGKGIRTSYFVLRRALKKKSIKVMWGRAPIQKDFFLTTKKKIY